MLNLDKKKYWIVGLSVAIISFIMLFLGVKGVLAQEVNTQNILVYIGFSVLIGIVTSLLVFFRFKVIFVTFMVGLVVGFFEMYRAFIDGLSGWGDLVGILSLFIWVISGLVTGILAQTGYYLYKRFRK